MERSSRKPVSANRHYVRRLACCGSNIEIGFAANAMGLSINKPAFDDADLSVDMSCRPNLKNCHAITAAAVARTTAGASRLERGTRKAVSNFSAPDTSIGNPIWAAAWPGAEYFASRLLESAVIPIQTFARRVMDDYYRSPVSLDTSSKVVNYSRNNHEVSTGSVFCAINDENLIEFVSHFPRPSIFPSNKQNKPIFTMENLESGESASIYA